MVRVNGVLVVYLVWLAKVRSFLPPPPLLPPSSLIFFEIYFLRKFAEVGGDGGERGGFLLFHPQPPL